MKKIFTHNILSFAITGILLGTVAYAATTIQATDVSYSNQTAQTAIDDLYSQSNQNLYFFGNTYLNGTTATGYKSYLTIDYNEIMTGLGSRVFIKLKPNGTKQACIYRNDHLFCISPNEYETSKELIREEFGGESASCTSNDSVFVCDDVASSCLATSEGDVGCNDIAAGMYCVVDAVGKVSCGSQGA